MRSKNGIFCTTDGILTVSLFRFAKLKRKKIDLESNISVGRSMTVKLKHMFSEWKKYSLAVESYQYKSVEKENFQIKITKKL